MLSRATILPLLLVAMTTPAFAQSNDNSDPDFTGRVSDSPMPVPKYRANRNGDETVPQATFDDETVDGGGPGSSERNLPIVTRGGGESTAELDAGGRIKAVPPSDGRERETGNSRFVRAPQSTYDDTKDVTGAPIRAPKTGLRAGAQLRQLDKMTGQIVTFDIEVGQTLNVDRLLVRLDACRSPSDNDTHGTMAFLKVWDTKITDGDAVFSGWMFAESPALSALDHSRYDLWVINCTTASADTSAGKE